MDSRQKFTEALKETEDGFLYTFDSNLVLDLMELNVSTAIQIVMHIEAYVNQYWTIAPEVTYELCGVVKGENPFFYIVSIDNSEHMIFEFLFEVDSDTYLDWYNENLVIS